MFSELGQGILRLLVDRLVCQVRGYVFKVGMVCEMILGHCIVNVHRSVSQVHGKDFRIRRMILNTGKVQREQNKSACHTTTVMLCHIKSQMESLDVTLRAVMDLTID